MIININDINMIAILKHFCSQIYIYFFFSVTPISSHVCYIDQWEVDSEFKNDSRLYKFSYQNKFVIWEQLAATITEDWGNVSVNGLLKQMLALLAGTVSLLNGEDALSMMWVSVLAS